jgi:hypothetical protein
VENICFIIVKFYKYFLELACGHLALILVVYD